MQRGRVARGHIAILAFLFLFFVLSYSARAQANPSSLGSEHSASAANGEPAKAHEDDEQAQFKHSWMVQWVAKLTGLNLDYAYWLCVVLNFAIVAGAVGYFSKKSLPGMFRNRTSSIQQAMQEARKASEDATGVWVKSKRGSPGWIPKSRGCAPRRRKKRPLKRCESRPPRKKMKRKIVESAEQEIAAAAKLARRELTNYAANLAVSLAARQIKVDPATDQALVQDFARELSPKSGQDKN